MKGDRIVLKEDYFKPAKAVVDLIEDKLTDKFVITIAGESGSGKSVLATTLNIVLADKQIPSFLIQQDDFFKLPPRTNHENHKKDIHKNVGPQEVHLDKMQGIIDAFRHDIDEITKPSVDYKLNIIDEEKINIKLIKVLIIEGTYTTLLNNVDLHIFMERTYKETFKDRMARGREAFDPFIEQVLEIEHNIISEHKINADILFGVDFTLRKNITNQ